MRVFVFPGQGSQKIGMGKNLYENFFEAKEVFQEVDDALSFNLSNLMFNGDIAELSNTENTQPALMSTGIAVLKVLEKITGKKIHDLCKFACGHSLGEFTALCASGVISLKDTAKILRIRGRSMQKAVPQGQGAMAALISSNFKDLGNLLKKVSSLGICQVANENSDEQVVISGDINAIEMAVKIAKNYSIKRAIMLNVSAPFHCDLMIPAQEELKNELNNIKFENSSVPIICNFTAYPASDANILKENIIYQVTKKVRWKETINFLGKNGINELVELGAGKVLTGITKKSSSKIIAYNIENKIDLEENFNKFN